MTIIKKALKIIMIIIMLLGITLSVVNFITTEIQAIVNNPVYDNPTGTLIWTDDGYECQGDPFNC